MTTKERQLKNTGIYFISQIINSVLPFITLPIFTRILTKEDYGIWGLAQIYAIFASGIANFGMMTAYQRNFFQYREDREKSSQLLYSSIVFVLLNFLAIAALTYKFQATLAGFIIRDTSQGPILFWAFCGQFFYGLFCYYLTYYKNEERAKDYTLNLIIYSLLNFFGSLLLVAYFRVGVIGLVYAQFFSAFIIFCGLSFRFFSHLKPSLNKNIFKESLFLAYPLTPKIFLGVINSQFDKYMIGLLATIGGVGIYFVGQKVAHAVFTFMTTIQNVYSPQVYRRMFDLGDEGGRSIGDYLTPFAYLSIAPALFVALFSEEITRLLTTESFHGASNIIIILCMFYGSMFFGKQPQLIYAKKTYITSFLTFISLFLNIVLNIPFIMKWGAIGAAWATLLAGLISGSISFAVSQHYYEIKWEYKKIAPIFFIFFASAILMILLRHFSVAYEFRLILKCASVFSYIYLGIKLKVITMENYTLIKNMIPVRRVVTSDHT